jgi:RNA polymerase sigma factor (sigma-70 family)
VNTEKNVEEYYANNAAKVRKMVDDIIKRYRFNITDKDDFYSIANEVFVKILDTYDGKRDFKGYLYSCLENRIKQEQTRRNALKNGGDKLISSLDDTESNEDINPYEVIEGAISAEDEFMENCGEWSSPVIAEYFSKLSPMQMEIAKLKSEGYSFEEIAKKLGITLNRYYELCNDMTSIEKTRDLISSKNKALKKEFVIKGEPSMNIPKAEIRTTTTSTSEKTKMIALSVISICLQLDARSILDNHPLQRASGQWSKIMQSNLISDLLQGNAIPPLLLAEQYINGVAYKWLLDGKQRLVGAIYSYLNDGFKISRNVERNMIEYQANEQDENGNIVCDSYGIPKKINCEFDIRNKKFSQLPKELQERFKNYNLQITLNLNCTKEQIEYDIRRYNQSKPMSVAQKGVTYLGEDFTKIVKTLSAKPFFKEKGNYSPSESYNGKLDRTIIESIMSINFLDKWNKSNDVNCSYLKENAKVKQFNVLESIIDRLYDVVTDEVNDLFDSKNSFVWFTLFDRFTKTKIGRSETEDEKFVEFLAAYKEELHSRKIDGMTTEDIDYNAGTKGRVAVRKKLEHIEALMNEFLGIEVSEGVESFNTNDTIDSYISEFCSTNLMNNAVSGDVNKVRAAVGSMMFVNGFNDYSDKAIQEYISGNNYSENDISDMELYSSVLNDWSSGIDKNSRIFDMENIPVLLKVISKSYEKEMDENFCIEWFKGIVENYGTNVKFSGVNTEDYNMMLNSLNNYVTYKEEKLEDAA